MTRSCRWPRRRSSSRRCASGRSPTPTCCSRARAMDSGRRRTSGARSRPSCRSTRRSSGFELADTIEPVKVEFLAWQAAATAWPPPRTASRNPSARTIDATGPPVSRLGGRYESSGGKVSRTACGSAVIELLDRRLTWIHPMSPSPRLAHPACRLPTHGLAGRFPDDSADTVVALVRDAGGEIVANVDETWTQPRRSYPFAQPAGRLDTSNDRLSHGRIPPPCVLKRGRAR